MRARTCLILQIRNAMDAAVKLSCEAAADVHVKARDGTHTRRRERVGRC